MPIIQFKQFVLKKQAEWGRGLSIKEISEGSGVSRDTISRLMKGRVTRIDTNTVFSLCKFFDVVAGKPVPFVVYDPDEG